MSPGRTGEEESEMHSTTIAVGLAKSVFEVAVSQRPGEGGGAPSLLARTALALPGPAGSSHGGDGGLRAGSQARMPSGSRRLWEGKVAVTRQATKQAAIDSARGQVHGAGVGQHVPELDVRVVGGDALGDDPPEPRGRHHVRLPPR